jgi:hypothetical protein
MDVPGPPNPQNHLASVIFVVEWKCETKLRTGKCSRKMLRFHFQRGLINVPIRQKIRPAKAKYINSFEGSMVLMKLSTIVSAGMDTYLAATEDTMIRAKTADQITIVEKCFIMTFLLSILVLLIHIHKSACKDMD